MKTFNSFCSSKHTLCRDLTVVLQQGATFWDLEAANLTSYEEALVYTLQGLVNQVEYDDDTHKDAPELFFNQEERILIFHHPTKCG